ncbi:MAG: GyrI-like domain-containing protein [Planctomycetota bacterium]
MTETKLQPALVIKGKAKVEEAGQAIGGILGRVGQYLEQRKVRPAGGPFTRTFQFKDGVLEFEAGFPVPKGIAPQGEIMATELPGTLVATTVHVGSPDTSELAYQALHAWMAKNDKSEAGAPWEVYLTDSEQTPADQAQTRIYLPVR